MKKKLKLAFLLTSFVLLPSSISHGGGLVFSNSKTEVVNADETNSVTLGLGNAMLNYINNNGNEVTSNEFFNYTIAVGSLSSGTGDTLGSYPAAYVVRANNKELGGADVGDLDYHTDYALGRMHSQNDKRFQWVITAKHNVSLNINVAKLLSYPTNSELKYYVFDGDIPNGSYVNDARLKATYKFNGVVNDGSIYNYSGELKSGQKFVLEWGFQYSGKRNINISSSGSQMFTATVTPTAQDSSLSYASLLDKVSNNSGNSFSDLTVLPLSSVEILHGDVSTSTLSTFETVASNSLTTSSGAQALNWRLIPAPHDNVVVKLIASEKVLLEVTRPILGTEWLTNTYINYWHNTELEKTINFEAAPADSSVFNFEHILQKGDAFYFEFGTTAADATRNMSCLTGGDVNTSLPVFKFYSVNYREENLHATHNLSLKAGLAATCQEYGYKDYYECSVCDAKFEDANGLIPITDFEAWKVGDGRIDKAHNLVHHPAKAATATETGNIEYWQCSACGDCYSDANGQNEIDPATVIIPINDSHTVKYDIYYNKALTNKKANSNTGDPIASYDNIDVSFNHGSPRNYSLVESVYSDNLAAEGTNASRNLTLFYGWQIRFASTDDAIIRYTAKEDLKISLNHVPSKPENPVTTWVGNSSIRFYVEGTDGTLVLLRKESISPNKEGHDGEYDISTSLKSGETLLVDMSTTDRNNVSKTISYMPAVTTKPSAFNENEAFDFDAYSEVETYKQTKINGFGWWFSSESGACDINQDNVLIEHYAYCLDLVAKYKEIYLDATTKSQINSASSKFISEFKAVAEASKFVFSYMHMRDYDIDWNDTEGSNLCLDYYDDAKTAFNSMSTNAKKVFCEDEHFIDEYQRLTQWANANKEYIDSDLMIKKSTAFLNFATLTPEFNSTIILVISLTTCCVLSIGLIYWRKKHEN